MTKAIDIKPIENATGIAWEEWLKYLESFNASRLSHREIVPKVYERLTELQTAGKIKVNNPGWWSQSITVAYEQHINRRLPGQKADGSYEVSVSKTLDGTMDQALAWWTAKVKNFDEFDGIKISGKPKVSRTEKWRYWRLNLADGSGIIAAATIKSPGKALFAVSNNKLKSSSEVESWRLFWKDFLNEEAVSLR